eukprot:11178444-Lingulodinium_polyedra.AAC.1
MQILENLTKNLEKYKEFAYRANQVKYAREGRRPTNEYAKEYQSLLAEELGMLETDELVAEHR